MVKSVHVLIVGSGISGLALANLLVHGSKKVKFRVTLFDSRPFFNSSEQSIGGGIGIWPPSQSVLRNIPNYQAFMEQYGFYMPSPSYRDSNARILARATEGFSARFPVQCLDRHDLTHMLYEGLQYQNDVEMIAAQKIYQYKRDKDQIVIQSNDNKIYQGDILIACDGIHSKIRNRLMTELGLPPIFETDLGYTYFRANTRIPDNTQYKWWSATFETWGCCQSKKYGNYALRFGYVPLKPPHVFWFIALKTQKNHPYLSPIRGVKIVDDETKAFLLDLIQNWKPISSHSGEIVVNYEELIHLTQHILRTDIAKIKNVEQFPWTSRDNRVVLMGDSAHATAPNIAQGAGLCIEDAAYLASHLNRVDYLHGLSEYERDRKPRAKTVQRIADLIATIGQIQNPLLRRLRDGIMHAAAHLTPSLQRLIFEYVVSYSLGGSKRAIYWQTPPLSVTDDAPATLFARVFPQYHLLEKPIKEFKTSRLGGSGLGIVTVEKPTFLAKLLGVVAGIPREMREQPFCAEVINLSGEVQCWKRIFGAKTPNQKTYSTTHSSYSGLKRHMYLSEGLGGFLDKAIRFIYSITIQPDKSLKYESQGLTCFDLFKIPLPAFLLPKSVWVEKPSSEGWTFDGTISFPLVGTLMHYYGHFKADKIKGIKGRRIIIAGGAGMIGKEVCKEFIKKGYDVYCLSRSATTRINIEGVKVRLVSEDWSDLIDKETIILNLSGANPGAKRWTPSVKTNIAKSRDRVIDTIIHNIERAHEKPLKYLQASAAGYYGDAGDAFMAEESEPILGKEQGTKFRVDVCKEIEQRANQADCPVVNLRMGHVLANTGGLLTYLRFAGLAYVGQLGSGEQFVPFVHIRDVARAIEFIASDDSINEGPINIAAPQPCRNFEIMKELRWIKWGAGIPLPTSLLKFLIGQSFVVLTDSERVLPQRLIDRGFQFNYPTIQEALQGLQ